MKILINGTTGEVRTINSPVATSILSKLGRVRLQRASYIEPVNSFLRLLFHTARRLFGDEGRAAAYTRSWKCQWRVNLGPGDRIIGPFGKRDDALNAEIEWLNNNLGKVQ